MTEPAGERSYAAFACCRVEHDDRSHDDAFHHLDPIAADRRRDHAGCQRTYDIGSKNCTEYRTCASGN